MTEPPDYGPPAQQMDRMPPQAVEVERAVLGACLISERAIDDVADSLYEESFYHRPHGRIFAAMLTMQERDEKIDQLTVSEELKRRGQLDEAGGVVYLSELAGGVASAANIEAHAAIVAERAIAREVIEVCQEAANRAYDGQLTAQQLVDWTERQVSQIAATGHKGEEPVVLESVLGETFEKIEIVHQSRRSVTGVDTGYSDLNDITSGWQPSMIVLAARPSVGKTALSLCFSLHAARSGTGVLFFSLEMSKEDLAQRFLAIETGVDLHSMRTGRLKNEDWIQMTRNVGRLAQMPIYIDDTSDLTVSEARTKSRRLIREHGIGLIVVDYLQLMSSHDEDTRGVSREQQVSRISRGLKGLSKDTKVPVMALSQLSRAPEGRKDGRPMLSDLRESGSVEQDADVVMFIYRPDMYNIKGQDGGSLEGVAEVIVAKQRNGPTGSVHLQWSKESASFENLAPEFRMEDEEVQNDLGF